MCFFTYMDFSSLQKEKTSMGRFSRTSSIQSIIVHPRIHQTRRIVIHVRLFSSFILRCQYEDYVAVIEKVKEILLKPLHDKNDHTLVHPVVKLMMDVEKSLIKGTRIIMVGSEFPTHEATDVKDTPEARIVVCGFHKLQFHNFLLLH